MSRIHLLHRAFVTLNIGAAVTGLGRDNFSNISLNVVLLLLVMLALRIKFWVDDEAYFEDVEKGRLDGGAPFYIGFALGIISWLIWLFAGFFVKDIDIASLLMVAALGPSTLWIVATMVRTGAYAEQVPWLFFNVFYMVGFYLCASATATWNPYSKSAENFITSVLALLIILFFLDLIVTRVLEQKRRSKMA